MAAALGKPLRLPGANTRKQLLPARLAQYRHNRRCRVDSLVVVCSACSDGSTDGAAPSPLTPSTPSTSGRAGPLLPSSSAVPQPHTPRTDRWDSLQAHSTADGDASSGGGSSGSSGGGGKGGGGGGGGGGGDEEEDRIMDIAQVEAAAAAAKVSLPGDVVALAQSQGLRSTAFNKYLQLQALGVVGTLVARVPWVRARMIADDRFLFKVVAECLIDTGCATVAEVRKRGDDFWAEFEFYLSDLLVGIALDVVLVSLMAPKAVLGGGAMAAAGGSALSRWLASVPSAVFEASIPAVRRYTLGSRVACLGIKFLEYSLAGIVCGFIGQGIANSLMLLKRQMHGTKEDDVAVPPLVKTALVWGLFMGVSSNVRYQIVFGLERLVDMTIAAKVPQVAYGTTVAIRFVNNVIGGENFIDMARWAGVQ